MLGDAGGRKVFEEAPVGREVAVEERIRNMSSRSGRVFITRC